MSDTEMPWGDDQFLDFIGLKYEIEAMVDKSETQEMLRTQLKEFEMLKSMFSNPGEFEMDNHYVFDDIEAFVKGLNNDLPHRLDYRINLIVGGEKLEVYVNLPRDYPLEEPDVFVRSNSLTKTQQNAMNKDLLNYISSLKGEICIYPAVSWLQEFASLYFVPSRTVSRFKGKPGFSKSGDSCVYCRYWNYSQMIENKMKVKCIVELAEACGVSGFCMRGKPAIICVEGWKSDCDDWWSRVRQMNWKNIMCKRKEEKKITSNESLESFRKFSGFDEIFFDRNKYKSKRIKHTDMGEFHKYLQSHDCGHVFKDLFGIDGSIVHSNYVC